MKLPRTTSSTGDGRGLAALLVLLGCAALAGWLFLQSTGRPELGADESVEKAGNADGRGAAALEVGALADAEEGGARRAGAETLASTSDEVADGDAQGEKHDEPDELSTVVARLVDGAGGAISAAELRSIYVTGKPRGAACFDTANRDGGCEIQIPDAHMRHWKTEVFSMTFQATAPMRATTFVVTTPKWHGVTDLGDVVLEPGGAVRGRVVDAAGSAMAGATVYLGQGVLTGDRERMRVTGPDADVRRPRVDSRADGSFEFPGAAIGSHVLYVGQGGKLWTLSDPFDVFEATVHDAGTLVLDDVPPEEMIRGRVVRPNGQPAGGATVAYEQRTANGEGTLTAEDDGSFVFYPGGGPDAEFVARDPRQEFGMSAPVKASRGTADLVLELTPLRVLALLVVDSKDGSPIEDASVMPFLEVGASVFAGGGRPVPGQDWLKTDGAGRVDVEMPPTKCSVSASIAGYEAKRGGPWGPLDVPAELRIELDRDPAIEGRVLAYGQPVAGAKVLIGQRIEGFVPLQSGFPIRFFNNSDHGVVSDAEGRFSCPVDPEWTEITVIARPSSHATGELDLTVAAGEGARGVEIQVTSGGAIEGAVTPPPGRAAEGLFVVASNGDGAPLTTRVGADDSYRLETLRPGPWRVEVREREPTNDTMSVAQNDEQKEFRFNADVVNGATTTFDLDARGLAQAQLFGTFSINGEPARGFVVSVDLARHEQYSNDLPAATIESDGTFVLNVPNGTCEVHIDGVLPSGHRLEVVRGMTFEGVRVDWAEDLRLGRVVSTVEPSSLEPSSLEYRAFRRENRTPNSEAVYLQPTDAGEIDAPSPLGQIWIQTYQTHAFGLMWGTIKVEDVAGG